MDKDESTGTKGCSHRGPPLVSLFAGSLVAVIGSFELLRRITTFFRRLRADATHMDALKGAHRRWESWPHFAAASHHPRAKLYSMCRQLPQQLERWAQTYRGDYELNIMGRRVIVVLDASEIRRILTLRPSKFGRGFAPVSVADRPRRRLASRRTRRPRVR